MCNEGGRDRAIIVARSLVERCVAADILKVGIGTLAEEVDRDVAVPFRDGQLEPRVAPLRSHVNRHPGFNQRLQALEPPERRRRMQWSEPGAIKSAGVSTGGQQGPHDTLLVVETREIQRRAAGCVSKVQFDTWPSRGTVYTPKQIRRTLDELYQAAEKVLFSLYVSI